MSRNIALTVVLLVLAMAASTHVRAATNAKTVSGESEAMVTSQAPKEAEGQAPSEATKETASSGATEAKELSGMSVLGNNEAPKALYIVPWKSSEIGTETDLRSGLLNDAMVPVDKEVFMRQLEFYEISSRQ